MRHSAIAAADEAASVDAPMDELKRSSWPSPLRPRPVSRRDRVVAAGPIRRCRRPRALHVRAAEAAFAAGRPTRAVAYLDAAIGRIDARRDRTRLGLSTTGSPSSGGSRATPRARLRLVVARSISSHRHRRPRVPPWRGLAQLLMLEGTFSEADKLAREAIRVARACDPPARRWEIHATTTLGVSLGWVPTRTARSTAARGRAMAREMDDPDELFRITPT